jgi:hypothetical protein
MFKVAKTQFAAEQEAKHGPVYRRSFRRFRLASLDEKLDILMYGVSARPNPSAWFLYALISTWRPGNRWASAAPPPWGINTAWNEHPHERARTTLHFVAAFGEAEEVAFLIEHGADVDARQSDGSTPLLEVAGIGGSLREFVPTEDPVLDPARLSRVVNVLIDHGADPNVQNRCGDSPLFVLNCFDCLPWSVACARLLMARGADLGLRNRHGDTFLERLGKTLDLAEVRALSDAWLLEIELSRAESTPGTKRSRL